MFNRPSIKPKAIPNEDNLFKEVTRLLKNTRRFN